MAEEALRGRSVGMLPRPNEQYTSGRTCSQPGCETTLSRYNKWSCCWQHEPRHAYVPYGKRGRRYRVA